MRILIDMDGPLCDFDEHGYKHCADLGFELDVEYSVRTKRYFTDHLVNKQDRQLMRRIIEKPGWFESLPPTPGAIEGMSALVEAGLDVWICTKPLEANPTCRDAKGGWVREHLPDFERKLIITPDKSIVSADALLDDAPKPQWFDEADWTPIIFRTPFNGPGSQWEKYPQWDWNDRIGDLIDLMVGNYN